MAHLARDLVLELEQVNQPAGVGLGPEVRVRPGFDELDGHPHVIVGPPNGSLEDVLNGECVCDLREGELRILQRDHGSARDHLETFDLGELRDDLFRDPVAEVVVLFSAQILEGQHCHGRRVSRQAGDPEEHGECDESAGDRAAPREVGRATPRQGCHEAPKVNLPSRRDLPFSPAARRA